MCTCTEGWGTGLYAHHQKQAYKLISSKHRIDTIHTGWKKMIVAQTSKFINGFMPALTLK